ncbi:MAG: hypothetical protein IJL74_04805 [Bacilli bacterium]|nr:hypothetical protein [Bacilli bacterium]
MTLRTLVLINGLAVLIDLISLTFLWIMNMDALRNVNRYLTNEQEEKELMEAMEEVEEEIEVLD